MLGKKLDEGKRTFFLKKKGVKPLNGEKLYYPGNYRGNDLIALYSVYPGKEKLILNSIEIKQNY